jgi:signal transduction histidine kinase
VIDQGSGIGLDQQHKLFNKFGQVDQSDSRPREGTGLGLVISKEIVEKHNGTMGFSTVPSKGSTFWFELPAAPDVKIPPTRNQYQGNNMDSRTDSVVPCP